uniref:Integrase catalytic domain-containing protein n=1 Tax=Cyprinus carpio carpio TaxID=630221 RepID=A0A8C0XU21_CYPCA
VCDNLVYGAKLNSDKHFWLYNSTVSFHSFPVEEDLRKKWIVQIRRDDFQVNKNTKVCSVHFRPDDFMEEPRLKHLKKGVFPTLFEWNHHQEQPPRLSVWERRERLLTLMWRGLDMIIVQFPKLQLWTWFYMKNEDQGSNANGFHPGSPSDRFYWLGWFGDVKRWCRECVDCGSRKAVGKQWRAPLQSVVTSRPYERVAVDILGPLPETPKENKYIVVIGDYFSRWTEAFPLPNQEAETVAKLLVEQWVCRFGAPRIIHTDQGRNFESRLFKEVCQLLNIYKTRTSPYHPQSDGMVERFNRTLASMLSLFVDDNQANWDILLPYVMMAYRSSVHSSTGFTPYKVVFGKEIVLPVDVMLNLGGGETFSSTSDLVG